MYHQGPSWTIRYQKGPPDHGHQVPSETMYQGIPYCMRRVRKETYKTALHPSRRRPMCDVFIGHLRVVRYALLACRTSERSQRFQNASNLCLSTKLAEKNVTLHPVAIGWSCIVSRVGTEVFWSLFVSSWRGPSWRFPDVSILVSRNPSPQKTHLLQKLCQGAAALCASN